MKISPTVILNCLLCYFAATTHAAVLRTVALSENPAPVTEPGAVYNFIFEPPLLNNSGQTAFRAGFASPTFSSLGIFSEGSGGINLVAQIGGMSPIGTGVNYESFGIPLLNNLGQIAFGASLDGSEVTSANNQAIFSESEGDGLASVVRTGDASPIEGEIFTRFSREFVFNDLGQTAFSGSVTGNASNNTIGAIFSEGGGNGLRVVAQELTFAPGNSGLFGLFRNPVLNNVGETAFRASVFVGGGIDGSNNTRVYSEGKGNGLALVASGGAESPAGAGIDFTTVGFPVLNDHGVTVFRSSLTGTGANGTTNTGLFKKMTDASLAALAIEADVSPIGDEIYFFSFAVPVLNSSGQIAFRANLFGPAVTSSNSSAVFREGMDGTLEVVARNGDHAPGTPTTEKFKFASFDTFINDSLVLNSAGQTAFQAQLAGASIDFGSDMGIWAEDRTGKLRLIAREGDQLEVAKGDFRTIRRLRFFGNTGNEDGRRSGFNDLGQLAFVASFTDGTDGIFVSDIATVPEPGTVNMFLLAIMAFGFRRCPFEL